MADRNDPIARLKRDLLSTENDFELKDSGERQEFSTGSQRDTQTGKGRFDLMFSAHDAVMRLALLFEKGGEKYDDDNWKKGQPLSRYLDSALRHLWHVAGGHEDEDHAIQAAWNCLCLAETLAMVRAGKLPAELNDLGYE